MNEQTCKHANVEPVSPSWGSVNFLVVCAEVAGAGNRAVTITKYELTINLHTNNYD